MALLISTLVLAPLLAAPVPEASGRLGHGAAAGPVHDVAHGAADDAAEALLRAGVDDREAALEAAEATLEDAVLTAVLFERIDRHERTLGRGAVAKKLQKLAETRAELDVLRKEYLGIVEDEKRYFTPYKQPQVTAEREAEYREVQKELDRRLIELNGVWDKAKPAKLPKKARAAIEDVQWSLARYEEIQPGGARPEWFAGWMLGLDPEAETVTLATFAWDEAERDRLAHARRIREWNVLAGEAAMEDKDLDELARPDRAALSQVRVTNDYRELLGRDPVAWHPQLQASAKGHSNYMDRNGIITHFQDKNPDMRAPNQRARAAGYTAFRSENCSFGLPAPEASHGGWIRSPGHHRNIVSKGNKELGVALSGAYWTQNFGRAEPKLELPEPKSKKKRGRR